MYESGFNQTYYTCASILIIRGLDVNSGRTLLDKALEKVDRVLAKGDRALTKVDRALAKFTLIDKALAKS